MPDIFPDQFISPTGHFEVFLKAKSKEYPDLTLEGLCKMYFSAWPGRIPHLLLDLARHVDLPDHLVSDQPTSSSPHRGFFEGTK